MTFPANRTRSALRNSPEDRMTVIGSKTNKKPRSRAGLEAQLHRQFKYLANSAILFDEGDHDEATRLATTLRVLLHDTAQSTSLLTHLGLKGQIHFVDTGIYRARRRCGRRTCRSPAARSAPAAERRDVGQTGEAEIQAALRRRRCLSSARPIRRPNGLSKRSSVSCVGLCLG